jgi:glycosyltransferase EpsE
VNEHRRRRPRVLYGVTAAVTARAFLPGQLSYLGEQGWEVHLVCGEPGLDNFAATEGIAGNHVVPATRDPSAGDLRTLVGLWRVFRRVRPDVVVVGTPKVGVLGSLAAAAARAPRRIYLLHGYRAEGLTGGRRRLMRALETIACAAATDVVAVSPSLAARLTAESVVPAAKVRVLGAGSANGVDLHRFSRPTETGRSQARRTWGLPDDAHVVASVGRLTRDKGLQTLPSLWGSVSARDPLAWLLVAGHPEPADAADHAALEALAALPRVRLLGQVGDVERVYAAADVLLLLSRREGLGMVALEAAACGVPTVAYAVTGVRDAVLHGRTGNLAPDGDVMGVEAALLELLTYPSEARRLGSSGAERVAREFDRERVWQEWAALISRRGEQGHPPVGDGGRAARVRDLDPEPLVSIAMGVYNAEATVAEALDSIVAQTYRQWELVVCDDGSTDGTAGILSDYQRRHPGRIRVVRQSPNRGLAAALNVCIGQAAGSLVARMDADDRSHPDRLARQVHYLQTHPEVDLVGSAMRRFDGNVLGDVVRAPADPGRDTLRTQVPFCHATVLAWREVFTALRYNESDRVRRTEDVDLWFRFFAAGLKGRNLDEPLYLVREDLGAIRRRTLSNRWNLLRTNVAGFRRLGYPPVAYARPLLAFLKVLVPARLALLYRDHQRRTCDDAADEAPMSWSGRREP